MSRLVSKEGFMGWVWAHHALRSGSLNYPWGKVTSGPVLLYPFSIFLGKTGERGGGILSVADSTDGFSPGHFSQSAGGYCCVSTCV